MGQWLFTGSQEAPMMQGISESMAGRAAILQLLPFSLIETAVLAFGDSKPSFGEHIHIVSLGETKTH